LSDVTDPNLVLDLRTKLDAQGYYDEHEIERVVRVLLDDKAKQRQLEAALTPVADRLLKQYQQAREALRAARQAQDAQAEKAAQQKLDALLLFRTDMGTYLRAYAFLSQILDYGNTDFEKRALFYRHLVRLLKFELERATVDLSEVQLVRYKLTSEGRRTLPLSPDNAPPLAPLGAGGGQVREKEKALLAEIIEQLNQLFGQETTDGDQLSYANVLLEKTLESDVLQKQAANNTEEQFAASPDLNAVVDNAVIDSMDAQQSLSVQVLNSPEIRAGLIRILLNQLGLYEKLKARATGV
jgi:type I restriction enzyme R subunit